MNRYNTCDSNTNDMNKLDIIKPTPKRLHTRSVQDCTYSEYDVPHPSQYHQTGLVEIGMEIKQRQKSKGHSLT